MPAFLFGLVELGDSELDPQHKGLSALVHAIRDEAAGEDRSEELAPLFRRLADAAREHFAEEERLMTGRDYPATATHRADHERLQRWIDTAAEEVRLGRLAVTDTVIGLLFDWLNGHILTADRDFTEWWREADAQAREAAGGSTQPR